MDNGSYITAALLDNLIQIPLVHRAEDDAEGDKEKQGQNRNSNYDSAIYSGLKIEAQSFHLIHVGATQSKCT